MVIKFELTDKRIGNAGAVVVSELLKGNTAVSVLKLRSKN